MSPEELLHGQRVHWDKMFCKQADMFGVEPSFAARKASQMFKEEGKVKILELGGGQGRDTLFFAQEGFEIHVVDYSQEGLEAIKTKAQTSGIAPHITTIKHDIRDPLPFEDATFDACYSHMLYCMALTTIELERLSCEVLRVLKTGGIHIYTVRNRDDTHYRKGIHRGEDMWEVGGFIVHFFSREKIELLAKGYEIVAVDHFEEGALPRKLFLVTLRK